jgi:hypothetical protein
MYLALLRVILIRQQINVFLFFQVATLSAVILQLAGAPFRQPVLLTVRSSMYI